MGIKDDMSKKVERVVGCLGNLIGVGLGIWFILWGLMNCIK